MSLPEQPRAARCEAALQRARQLWPREPLLSSDSALHRSGLCCFEFILGIGKRRANLPQGNAEEVAKMPRFYGIPIACAILKVTAYRSAFALCVLQYSDHLFFFGK